MITESAVQLLQPRSRKQIFGKRKADNAIHWINHYPMESMVCFVNTHPLDSDLSHGIAISSIPTTGP